MYKIGDKFIAKNNFPVGIEKEVEDEVASFDCMEGEEIEIVPISEDDKLYCGDLDEGEFKVVNNSMGSSAWFKATSADLDYILGK